MPKKYRPASKSLVKSSRIASRQSILSNRLAEKPEIDAKPLHAALLQAVICIEGLSDSGRLEMTHGPGCGQPLFACVEAEVVALHCELGSCGFLGAPLPGAFDEVQAAAG